MRTFFTALKRNLAIAAGLLLAAACASIYATRSPARSPYRYTLPAQTADGFETADLASVNLDPTLIADLFNQIADNRYRNINSLLIVRNDKLVVEEYFAGLAPVLHDSITQEPDWNGKPQSFDRDTLHTLQSVTKSVNSIVVGIAIDQKLITGVDEKISAFFPQIASKQDIRLNHFLSMTAGLEWNEWVPLTDPRNDCEKMNHSADPIGLLLARPSEAPAGSKFSYNGGISLALGEIVRQRSGMSLDQFAMKNLFEPLGITNVAWKGRFTNGVVHTSGGLYLRPRDMAKIGCMMLNNGRWRGRQIVSERWVAESTRKQAPDLDYGYQWWRKSFKTADPPVDSFFAAGYAGQNIFVFPSLRMVVVSTAWNPDQGMQVIEMLQKHIIPAAK